MSNTNRTILILGSGPGIGVGVAAHFASKGFTHVALVARNAQRLENEDAASVREAAPKTVVKTYAADLSDYEGVPKLLEKIVADAGIPEVVVYNASHLTKGEVGVYEAKDVEVDLRISTISLYTTSNFLLPLMANLAGSNSQAKPALLVTSGGLYANPYAGYFSLAVSKAAQHNLAMSLGQAYKGKGVHVAAVVVNGFVKPESETCSPKLIAGVFWDLYEAGVKGESSVWVGGKADIF